MVGKVFKNVGRVTLEWLDRHKIQYDEIYFGKPNADITIDDRSVRFDYWNDISEDLIYTMQKNNESVNQYRHPYGRKGLTFSDTRDMMSLNSLFALTGA